MGKNSSKGDVMRTLLTLALTALVLTLPALLAPAQQKADPPVEKKKDSSSESETQYPDKVTGKTLDQWIKELHSIDPGVREHAVRTLLLFGPKASRAVPDVIHMADQDHDISPRVNAIIVLMLLPEIRNGDVPAAVQALKRKATDDAQAVVRLHAALALGRFEEKAASAIPNLINASRDRSSWEIRKAAIGSLAKAGVDKKKKTAPDPRATQAILYALRTGPTTEGSARVRLEAVMALGAMGPPASPMTKLAVTRALQGRLRDRDKTVVVWSHVALMALENKVTEPYLKGIATMLKDRDVEARIQAARAMGQLGGFADKEHIKLIKTHVPDLLSALKDSESTVVSMSCWALGQLGRKIDPGDDVTTALTRLSKGEKLDRTVHYMALAALESIKGKKDIKELGDIKKELDNEKEKNKKPTVPMLP